MKRYWITGFTLTMVCALHAQQQEGRILYERTTQLQLRLAGMGDGMERNIPQTRTDKLEVLFGKNQSIRKPVIEETPEPSNFENGGIVIRTFAGGADDVSYFNYDEKRMVDQREFAGKKYIISDSIRPLQWKLTGESKSVLGLPCQEARAQRISTRIQTMIANGEPQRTEIADTANIVAWFTPAIAVPTGPEYQGQLPGAILEINVNEGRTIYKAIEISPKTDLALIKEPKSGKKVTTKEFADEQQKMMQEMQRNNGGRVQTFRVN
ncbi:MAG: GLPGLI family protein [Chitinophagaceae bacterium]|nr:MAG: GLPGLI family protein [Chitinophagaceae bacterium]